MAVLSASPPSTVQWFAQAQVDYGHATERQHKRKLQSRYLNVLLNNLKQLLHPVLYANPWNKRLGLIMKCGSPIWQARI